MGSSASTLVHEHVFSSVRLFPLIRESSGFGFDFSMLLLRSACIFACGVQVLVSMSLTCAHRHVSKGACASHRRRPMSEQLFRSDSIKPLPERRPRAIIRPRFGGGVEVYLGGNMQARDLVPTHWDNSKSHSHMCRGQGCRFCGFGWATKYYLYLAARLASTCAEVVACVSDTQASAWLSKRPDFKNRFRIEKSNKGSRLTYCVELTTHGRLVDEWHGFDIRDEMEFQFNMRYTRCMVGHGKEIAG